MCTRSMINIILNAYEAFTGRFSKIEQQPEEWNPAIWGSNDDAYSHLSTIGINKNGIIIIFCIGFFLSPYDDYIDNFLCLLAKHLRKPHKQANTHAYDLAQSELSMAIELSMLANNQIIIFSYTINIKIVSNRTVYWKNMAYQKRKEIEINIEID